MMGYGQCRITRADRSEKAGNSQEKISTIAEIFEKFFLWVAGAAVGVVPVFMKHFTAAAAEKFSGSYNMWQMTLSDFDFSFTSVSALFVLFLEGCLINDEFPAWKSFIRFAVFVCLVIMGAVYLISFPYQDDFFSIWNITPHDYNILTMCFTIVFGFVCHVCISLRKEETL